MTRSFSNLLLPGHQDKKQTNKQTEKHESPHTGYKAEQVAQEARLGMF